MSDKEKTLKEKVDFEKWWTERGIYIDPDTDDVSWFDKRKGLAEEAFRAGQEALTALEEKIKEYEELYEDPCHAECVINENNGKREWLLHVPKDPPEPMEGDIQLKADYYGVGTRVCIYEPIKEAPTDGK